ncbi:MAG: Inner membrane permease YgbN [Alphaproteobacteria bacterium ADurb.Bin438]|nr:MAG: Inner membrane permease YgbN [Alphaproteobacteria bacterium ADurb.Bin438]
MIYALIFAIAFIIIATAKFKVHPFLALLTAAFGYGIAVQMPLQDVVKSVNDGFGGTIGYIGIVIIAGTIIGTFLEKTGGAIRLAKSTLKITGEKNVPATMSIMGFVVSIPVFCDSGFVILSSLNKALTRKAKITLASSAIALSLGLYATHTMVPPTPGPIAAAGIVEADLGQVIMYGLMAAFVACFVGWIFSVTYASKIQISPDAKEGEEENSVKMEELEKNAPCVITSIIPILLPIVLIVLSSIAKYPSKPFGEGQFIDLLNFFGQPVVALLIGVVLAFLLPKNFESKMISSSGWVGEAILAAATIIIITGSGGAFGKVLQNSGIAKEIGASLQDLNLGIFLPFIIAAAIKTAQGSSTVAIITTASLLAPLLGALGLDSEAARALSVIAIGAGAMVVSHANDSYFWVVTQFSNMDTKDGFKLQTLGTLIEGVAAMIAVYVISLFVL